MGAPPPTRMAPMDTCTEERRVLLMGLRPWVVRFYRCDCYHAVARISLFGESPARAGEPKAQLPPGNAQAPERQTAELHASAGLLEGGGFRFHPPKGSGAYSA